MNAVIRPAPFLIGHTLRNALPPLSGSFAPAVRYVISKYTKYSFDPMPSPVPKSFADGLAIPFCEHACFGKFKGIDFMKFSASLKLNHVFRRLYRTSGFAGPYLILYARKNRTDTNRVGITVGKKLGKAHIRNRIRRRLREAYRLNEDRFQPGWDIVVVGRGKALDGDFADICKCYLSLAKKAGILREEEA